MTHFLPSMNITELKAHVFDAEQALTFAREAIEEKDTEALATALRSAKAQVDAALVEVTAGKPE